MNATDRSPRRQGKQAKTLPVRSAPKGFASIYDHARALFAIRPPSGVYVLLPLPGFTGAFLAASWVLALLLFGAIGSNPFIYFQF